ncbi:MAG: PEP-CTERM sorting domain-containing protein [Planctomycetaceae bacterium]|nr:PEP-CTERM sorting domain-containing protein [Planctomycetaceae bacterium]
MRKNCLFVLSSLMAILISAVAYADTVTLTGGTIDKSVVINSIYVSPFNLHDQEKDFDFIGFCGDPSVTASNNFLNGSGEVFSWALLTEYANYGPDLKSTIQELFDHTYSHAFDSDGSLLDITVGRALQVALWNTLQPGFMSTTGYSSDGSLALAGEFLSALAGTKEWGDINYKGIDFGDSVKTTLVVFAPNPITKTQTLISANYLVEQFTVTPEPATLAILGFGFFGVGFIARRRYQ